jgi:hypothetical protein
MDDKLVPPKPGKGDVAHSLVKGAIEAVPYIGSMASAAFSALITPPLDKRKQKWTEAVGAAIEELRTCGIDIEALRDDPRFVDAVLQASRIALTTSQQEKLAALQNAIRNSASREAPDIERQHLFLNLVDRFTGWHLRFLDLFDDPRAWYARHDRPCPEHARSSCALAGILNGVFPELQSEKDLREHLWLDLQNNGLIRRIGLENSLADGGAFNQQTTAMGREFVQFVMRNQLPQGRDSS